MSDGHGASQFGSNFCFNFGQDRTRILSCNQRLSSVPRTRDTIVRISADFCVFDPSYRISRHTSQQFTQMTVFVSENHRVPSLSANVSSHSVTSFSTTTMQTSDYESFRTSTVPSVTAEIENTDCDMENNETCEGRQLVVSRITTPIDVIKNFATGKMTDHRYFIYHIINMVNRGL